MRLSLGFVLAAACAPLAARAGTERYAGFLPCADCPAIVMELTLLDGTPARYEQRLTYVDTRDGDKTFASAGQWTVKAGTIELTEARSRERRLLRREGDILRLLDNAGREIDSPRPQLLLRSEREFVGEPVTVTKDDANAPLELKRGQHLVVRLPSTPGTGYRWTIRHDPQSALLPLATAAYERNAGTANLMGAPGTETWKLAAFTAGRQTLVFEYRRPWEKDAAAAQTLSFPVTVR